MLMWSCWFFVQTDVNVWEYEIVRIERVLPRFLIKRSCHGAKKCARYGTARIRTRVFWSQTKKYSQANPQSRRARIFLAYSQVTHGPVSNFGC